MRSNQKVKIKAVVDTNIFLNSWFDDDENCNYILNLIDLRKLKLMFSQDMIGELIYISKKYAIKNMSSEKPRIALLQSIAESFYWGNSVDTSKTKCPQINDKYDEMFLKCAIEGKVDFLISNDFRSGLHNVEIGNLKIVSGEEFVPLYEESLV